jgi:hypothetical protein
MQPARFKLNAEERTCSPVQRLILAGFSGSLCSTVSGLLRKPHSLGVIRQNRVLSYFIRS